MFNKKIILIGAGLGMLAATMPAVAALAKDIQEKVTINVMDVNPLIWPSFAVAIDNAYSVAGQSLTYWWTDALENGQVKYDVKRLLASESTWDWGWRWSNTRYAMEIEIPFNGNSSPHHPDKSAYIVLGFNNFVAEAGVYKENISLYSTVAAPHHLPKFDESLWQKTDVWTSLADPFNIHGDLKFTPGWLSCKVSWFGKEVQTIDFFK